MDGQVRSGRIEFLDLCRSIAIVLMVVFHFIYDLMMFDFLTYAQVRGFWGQMLSGSAAGLFMILSGVSAHFSRSNLKRGFKLFVIAMALTVVTTIANSSIKFGVLHFLSVCMMLYGLVGERKIFSMNITPVLSVIAFFATKPFIENSIVKTKLLFPLGFKYEGFYSSDYYPLLPWIFLFIIGIYFGGVIKKHRGNKLLSASFPRALTFPGRHSLAIYIIHQPILLGLVWLLSKF